MVLVAMTLAGIVILAGGNSKRMGSPKAKLTLPSGETLLDYHVRHAIPLNVPIMIADNKRGFEVDKKVATEFKTSIFHIEDYVPSDESTDSNNISNNKNDGQQIETGGALVAIESALQALSTLNQSEAAQATPSHYLLVVSCDSLISAPTLWQHLRASVTPNQNNNSVICLSDDSHLYPLLALYSLSIESELRAYIDSGQRRVMRFIEPICQAVTFDPQWHPLTNFNTPEDFAKACQALYR